MNQDIQRALLDLFSVCLEVTGAGRYHAHMNYSAHTEGISVYVLPAGTDYQSPGYDYPMWVDVYVSGRETGDVLKDLKGLTGRVAEFLIPAQEEAA